MAELNLSPTHCPQSVHMSFESVRSVPSRRQFCDHQSPMQQKWQNLCPKFFTCGQPSLTDICISATHPTPFSLLPHHCTGLDGRDAPLAILKRNHSFMHIGQYLGIDEGAGEALVCESVDVISSFKTWASHLMCLSFDFLNYGMRDWDGWSPWPLL